MAEALEKFDAYAMTNPKTTEDICRLLDECINELEYLNQLFDKVFESGAKP